MENKIRNTLNEIYFGKTKDIVNGLRSVQPLAEANKMKDLQASVHLTLVEFLGIFIGPRYTWGPIYGSESLKLTERGC